MAKTDNIKVIRLSTGEELIGEVLTHTADKLVVKNPVRIVVIPTADQANPKVGFGPFTQWTEDKELTLNSYHVTFTGTPINEFLNQYSAMFGGLVIPPSSKIVTP